MIDLKYIRLRKRNENNNINWHQHESHEIVYYKSGSGTTVVDNETYKYEAGSLLFIPANTPHYETSCKETEVIFMTFEFSVEASSFVHYFTLNTDLKIKLTFDILALELISDEIYNLEIATNLLENIVIYLKGKIITESKDGINKDILKQAFTHLSNNYAKNIDLVALANSFGYSYDRFRHIFKDRFGQSPKQLVTSKRIDAAKFLLLEDDISIEHVAFECGYTTSNQFATSFKKNTGYTPSEYRLNHINEMKKK